jgi:hypothetical protein
MPVLRGHDLFGYLDGSTSAPAWTKSKTVTIDSKPVTKIVANPDYKDWLLVDQQLVSVFLGSLEPAILAQVHTLTTSAEIWQTLARMYSSQSKARVNQLRVLLSNTKKLDLSAAE